MEHIDPARLPNSWRAKYLRGEKISLPGGVALKGLRESMPASQFQPILDNYIDTFKSFYDYFEKLPRTPVSVAAVQQEYDEVIKFSLGSNLSEMSCKKGCSACCHISVAAIDGEVDLIAMNLRQEGRKISRTVVARQAQYENLEYVQKLSWKDRSCVFLGDDGACTIYEYRPLTCRKYLVASDPRYCDSRTSKRDPSVMVHPTIEAYAAAFSSATDGPKKTVPTLPAKLLKRYGSDDRIWL